MTSLGTIRDRELARRAGDGIEVALFWNRQTNCVTVTVSLARQNPLIDGTSRSKLPIRFLRDRCQYF
jgi:hypothetical protein